MKIKALFKLSFMAVFLVIGSSLAMNNNNSGNFNNANNGGENNGNNAEPVSVPLLISVGGGEYMKVDVLAQDIRYAWRDNLAYRVVRIKTGSNFEMEPLWINTFLQRVNAQNFYSPKSGRRINDVQVYDLEHPANFDNQADADVVRAKVSFNSEQTLFCRAKLKVATLAKPQPTQHIHHYHYVPVPKPSSSAASSSGEQEQSASIPSHVTDLEQIIACYNPFFGTMNLSFKGIEAIDGIVFVQMSRKCPTLRRLQLGFNPLIYVPAEVGLLQGLQVLSLHRTQIAQLPAEIGKLQKLRRLDVSRTALSELSVDAFAGLRLLRELSVYGTPLVRGDGWAQKHDKLQDALPLLNIIDVAPQYEKVLEYIGAGVVVGVFVGLFMWLKHTR